METVPILSTVWVTPLWSVWVSGWLRSAAHVLSCRLGWISPAPAEQGGPEQIGARWGEPGFGAQRWALMVPLPVLHVVGFAPVDVYEPPQTLAASCREEETLLLKNIRGICPPCAGLGSPCGASGDEVTSAAAGEGQAEFGRLKLSYVGLRRD